MGVSGFTPFIRKVCPEVIKPLANRFQDIHGKRVVFDGTLITQRLHFGQTPHPYRHVLGWFRICEELQRSDVSAVCVFDGLGRHEAKSREIKRRRETYSQAVDRGGVEQERRERLQFVSGFLCNLPTLVTEKDEDVTKVLDTLKLPPADNELQEAYRKLDSQADPAALQELPPATPEPPVVPPLGVQPSQLKTLPASLQSTYENFRESINELAKDVPAQMTKKARAGTVAEEREAPPVEAIEEEFPAPTIISKEEPVEEQPAPAPTLAEREVPVATLTKAQSQLSLMEGDLWSQMSSMTLADVQEDSEQFKSAVSLSHALLEESSRMSASFQKRVVLPTQATYRESKDILRAMGVLCLDAPTAIEGEAFASSIVLNGRADFVVSEDTDVLVYGAPLLRNVTSSGEPLEIVSAQDIQDSLGLGSSEYIDFALLLGTDFTQRIKNVGPQRALKFIKQYGTIENMLASEPKYPPRIPNDVYLEEINAARTLFSDIPWSPDLESFDQPTRDDDEVERVLSRYKLAKHFMNSNGWVPENALGGNMFNDSPLAL